MVDVTPSPLGSERASRRPSGSRRGGAPIIAARLGAFWAGGSTEAVAGRFASLAYLFRVANAGIAFLSQILLARLMGASEFGTYVYVWTWVLLLGTLTNLGLGSSPQRFIPTYLAKGELDRLRGFLRGGRWLAFGVSAGLAVLLAAGLAWFGSNLAGWPVLPLLLGLACLPFVVLTEVQGSIARSYDWAGLAMAPPYLVRPVAMILLVLGLGAAGLPVDALTAMIASLLACVLTALWQILALGRRLTPRVPPGPRRHEPLDWLRQSLPQAMVEGFYLLLTYCDVIVLERFVGADDVGVYYAATKLVALVAFVSFSVAAASAHKFTALHAQDRPEALSAFMRQAIRWTFWPSLAMAAALLLLGAPLLRLFGAPFVAGYPLLPVLLLGLLARAAIGPAERLLVNTGAQSACAGVYAIAFAVNILLNLALVPHFGIVGAAAATSAAMVVETMLLARAVRRRLGLGLLAWRRA